jgi:hypothetical protein
VCLGRIYGEAERWVCDKVYGETVCKSTIVSIPKRRSGVCVGDFYGYINFDIMQILCLNRCFNLSAVPSRSRKPPKCVFTKRAAFIFSSKESDSSIEQHTYQTQKKQKQKHEEMCVEWPSFTAFPSQLQARSSNFNPIPTLSTSVLSPFSFVGLPSESPRLSQAPTLGFPPSIYCLSSPAPSKPCLSVSLEEVGGDGGAWSPMREGQLRLSFPTSCSS